MRSLLLFVWVLGLLCAVYVNAHDLNDSLRADYASIEVDANTQSREFLTVVQMQELFTFVRRHPVVSLESLAIYDPTGEIGFCYGRAMAVHLRARQMGLKSSRIRKLFIIGDLREGADPEWRFHVTTLVQGPGDQWYAVDPVLAYLSTDPATTAVPEATWIRRVRETWDGDRRARLFRTDPKSIVPDISTFPATPADENGDRIVEFSFDPRLKPGFVETPVGSESVFELNSQAQDIYFLTANRFDFVKLDIHVLNQGVQSETTYAYRDYFKRLLDSLLGRPAQPFPMRPRATVTPPQLLQNRLFSPRFRR